MLTDNLRSNLTTVLERRGLSQAAFARAAGIDGTYVSRFFTGKVEPSFGYAEKMAAAVEIKLVDLLAEPEDFDIPVAPARKPSKSRRISPASRPDPKLRNWLLQRIGK